MENLDKLETAGVLSAVRAVITSSPGLRADHPLHTAAQKLERNLTEFNKRKGIRDHIRERIT